MLAENIRSIFAIGLIGAATLGAAQAPVGGHVIANNTPKFAAHAVDLGAVSASTSMEVSLWLNVHNRSELDSLAESLYDPTSPKFRQWLTHSQLVAQFAPTAAEAQTVAGFLASQGLTNITVGPDNFLVSAHGTAATVQNAFHVSLHQYQVGGKVYRGNTSDPMITGAAGALVSAVYGLDNLEFTHPVAQAGMSKQQTTTGSGPTSGGGVKSLAAGSGPGITAAATFVSTCFTGTTSESYVDSVDGITATFSGNGYTKSTLGCGYTPAEIRAAYNLNPLYKEGLDGTGQTIVIIDWCGSPTIRSDANAFSARYGLPPLTKSNFLITEYPTPSTCAATDVEINIDVEWAHAIAPGATINLLVPPSALFTDIDNAMLYAAVNQLGSVISGSYGSEEFYTPSTILITENLISEVAAVMGESANFSSGDSGDFTLDDPTDYPASVSAPADSPYATAVGGISLALNADNSIKWQTGWGNNQTLLIDAGSISDPPFNFGFVGGSGGGPSAFFAKPAYQHKLPGKYRQLPDISWLADPYTGGVIAISEAGISPSLIYEVYGGTSLACPMFSALWAIANQNAGFPLGQAAPYLYSLPAGAITDVLPINSSTNVTAKVTDSLGTTTYTAAQVAAPLEGVTQFYSVLWDIPLNQDTTVALTFGTDSGLTITKGWDNVTGMGTPNGSAFINAVAAYAP